MWFSEVLTSGCLKTLQKTSWAAELVWPLLIIANSWSKWVHFVSQTRFPTFRLVFASWCLLRDFILSRVSFQRQRILPLSVDAEYGSVMLFFKPVLGSYNIINMMWANQRLRFRQPGWRMTRLREWLRITPIISITIFDIMISRYKNRFL